ncbi:LOW QUALITY PROTEIN: hypothetical protein NC653_001862 [Populus alba x Populus x berolinensis]|uniref:AP2/ERF domain-containing protein n=1 Tax=Populus alba x Populus x berolinensis TaxID=444605 RepID=A0AAD6RM66_9ROSI|nr:LOW QUALITY PROTEIN: hypothetical protein NC653_001862 [Populus alba x Populus x berolinensis]
MHFLVFISQCHPNACAVYLGGYDKEEKAARAYDLAALKYWGPTTHINFPVGTYEKELEEMEHMTRQEFVANLRRRSSGFSRGASVYRGVTRHHQHGRWQARIGRAHKRKRPRPTTLQQLNLGVPVLLQILVYDVRRICSSSTLIASDLAKRSSKDSTPTTLEDYNSCASSSSISPQPLLAIAGCEASDELPDMVWSANTGESQQQQSVNSNSNDSTLMASSSRNSSNAAMILAMEAEATLRVTSRCGVRRTKMVIMETITEVMTRTLVALIRCIKPLKWHD